MYELYTLDPACETLPPTYVSVHSHTFDDAGISIYPNPGTGKFTITFALHEPATVSVSNLLGESLLQQSSEALKSMDVDLTTQPKGIYLVRVSSPGMCKSYKLIKE